MAHSELPSRGASAAVERKLRANTDAATASKGYDVDAIAIAKILVRHYGDEADAVLARVLLRLDEARSTKR